MSTEVGASTAEYALIAALLVGVFLIGGILLAQASKLRSDSSIDSISDMTPCSCIDGDCVDNRCY